jgi:diaminopimelate decarboxylase
MKRDSRHEGQRHFPIADGVLEVGGLPLTSIAKRAGRTPFYVYDLAVIGGRIRELRGALPREVSLHYAIKANPMPQIVDYLATLVDGMDVASFGELQLALGAGVQAAQISFAGPGKSNDELSASIASGVTINLESESELARVTKLGEISGATPVVAIRVNPDFELKSSGMKMGGGPKPFGVDAEAVPPLIHEAVEHGLRFRGFHIYAGSQNLSAESISETQEKTLDLACRLAESSPVPIDWLNIGGGFGIPYFAGEQSLDVDRIGERLHELLQAFHQRLPDVEVVIELGRYLVGEAGLYVCEVVDRKVSRGQVFLVTNGGLHHQLAASGNFGQVIRKNYPLAVGNRMEGKDLEEVNVVGPLCTPLDVLGSRVRLPKAEVGDLIVVFQSGAYGFSASPLGFLSHPVPAQIVVGRRQGYGAS